MLTPKNKVFCYFTVAIMVISLPVNAHILRSNCNFAYSDIDNLSTFDHYSEELPILIKKSLSHPNNYDLKYKIGVCYLLTDNKKKRAIMYLEEAADYTKISPNVNKKNIKLAPIETYNALAKAYQLDYQFNKAIDAYLKYKQGLESENKLSKKEDLIMQKINSCVNGIELLKNPTNAIVKNLGENINSPNNDYFPLFLEGKSTLLFTSNKALLPINTKQKKVLNDNIFKSELSNNTWSASIPLPMIVNTENNDRVVNNSENENSIIIFKNNGSDGNLFLSQNSNEIWEHPKYWGVGINSKRNEFCADLTPDNHILYFVSDRPGGFGGKDIYKCLKLPNGKWSAPQNLGPVVNTEYDETSVFVHPNGKELYFSSNGHNTMGGLDIFSSIIDSKNGFVSAPLNAGYPINSTGNDRDYKTSKNGDYSFIASDRSTDDALGQMDIYSVSKDEHSERDITIIVGRIINNSGEDLSNNVISVIDLATNEIFTEVFANESTGKFGIDLPIGASFELQYFVKGKEIYNEIITTKKGKGYEVLIRNIPYGN